MHARRSAGEYKTMHPAAAVREKPGRRNGDDARDGALLAGRPGLSGGCGLLERAARGAGSGSAARRGGPGRGSRGSERGDFGSASAAVLAIFRARGSAFARRQLLSGFVAAPGPLRDPTHACCGWIAPFGTTNRRAEPELAGHYAIRPL